MFTFSHPFKGIHKKFKSLKDRMINKMPVFLSDNELITPKCFVPLNDKKLQSQFEFFYIKGDRFLFDLDGVSNNYLVQKVSKQIETIVKNNLIIKNILPKVNVLDINFNNTIGYVETEQLYIVYSSENKGFLSKIVEFDKNTVNQLYIGTKNIFYRQKNKLLYYISETEKIEIKNFEFSGNEIIKQYENILMILDKDILYKIDLEKIINNNISITRTNVFGKGFKNYEKFIQITGGVYRFFYNSGKDISNLKLHEKCMNIKQKNNFCLIQYLDKEEVKNEFVKIEGLNISKTSYLVDYFVDFAYMKTDKNQGFIFVPFDDKIKIIRTNDFKVMSEIECDFITQQSNLQYTKAGILVLEDGKFLLLNNK